MFSIFIPRSFCTVLNQWIPDKTPVINQQTIPTATLTFRPPSSPASGLGCPDEKQPQEFRCDTNCEVICEGTYQPKRQQQLIIIKYLPSANFWRKTGVCALYKIEVIVNYTPTLRQLERSENDYHHDYKWFKPHETKQTKHYATMSLGVAVS